MLNRGYITLTPLRFDFTDTAGLNALAGMASQVGNNLTSHYNDLKTSTSRLSSGLRINSAADDAAGLAIRELMGQH